MPELTVKLGDQTLQTCRFDGELLRIGRSRENDVVLENLSVSRQHAQLRLHEGRFILTDMNSANGTLVNGVKVTKTEVVDEDVITIGKHKLHFRHQVLAAVAGGDDFSTEQRTVMVEPRSEAWLEVETGRLKGREFKITRFETSLGKAPSNDVVLTDDWLLGKKQAIILRKGNHSFEIQDLGGLRRVKVNGTAVAERADLKDGDRIEMGGTALVFHASEAAPKPTGRIPSEITAETPTPASKGRAAQFSRTPVEAAGNGFLKHGDFPDNESLDLEEGYNNLKITLKGEQAAPAPALTPAARPAAEVAPPAEVIGDEPALAEAGAGQEPAATPEAAPAEVHQAAPEPAMKAASMAEEMANAVTGANPVPVVPVNSNSNGKRNVFEDSRSSGRRRRKHHQRAAQKQDGNGAVVHAATEAGQAKPVEIDKAPTAPSHPAADEKEIQIWEAALKNASPAIRRQAARTLKKLTGRDYEV